MSALCARTPVCVLLYSWQIIYELEIFSFLCSVCFDIIHSCIKRIGKDGDYIVK